MTIRNISAKAAGFANIVRPGALMPRHAPMTHNYEGATYGRRTADWAPGNDSVNSALFGSSDILRSRSRDLIRKNAWANNSSETFASEVIGTGIKPQSQHPTPDRKAFLQRQWLDWTDYCDAYGTSDFYGLQSLALRSMVEGGECFVRLRYRKASDGFTVPLQIQLLEAEHCPTWKNEQLDNGNLIKQGIEFNKLGQRVAYWLYPVHPGERGIFGLFQDEQLQPVRVPAAQVLHLFRVVRPGQVRGEPWLSRALVRLYDLDQYTDAELMRKKIAALFAGFIIEPDAADTILPESPTLPGHQPTSLVPPAGVSFSGLEPGTMQKLRPGEDVKFSEPADVGSNFEPFLRSNLREVAAAVGISYEQLTGDLTGVNYSSIRAGLLKVRRWMEQIQHTLIVFQFCRPLWRAVIESAVFAGEITARDYQKSQSDYLRVKWITAAWKSVDPEKDLAADLGEVRAGFASRSQKVSERGYDVEEVDAEIKADNDRADAYGFVLTSDPRNTSDKGMLQGVDSTDDPPGGTKPKQNGSSGQSNA